MDDLISRQAAIDAVKQREWLTEDAKEILEEVLTQLPSAQPEPLTLRVNHELTKEEYDKLMHDMEDAPIVLLPSAQPEIIRCKDCEFWQDNNGGYPNMNCRWIDDETPDADDFCSYAERKGEQP